MESSPSIQKTCWTLRVAGLLPVLAVTAALSGCSSVGGDAGTLFTLARQSFSRSEDVQLDEAAAVPYASIGLRIGSSNQVMLILASNDNGKMLWTSAARIAIITKNGRIIGVAGLGHNLTAYLPPESGIGKPPTTLTWQADFPELGLYAVPITCDTHQAGAETIVIMGKNIQTRRIDEQCHSNTEQLNWTFQNTYWVDPESSLVWRSQQHVNPKLGVIETETLRAPG